MKGGDITAEGKGNKVFVSLVALIVLHNNVEQQRCTQRPPTQPPARPRAARAGISNTRPPTGSKPSQNSWLFSRLTQKKTKQ